ncbi:HD domain-containing phosphohydrolase [Pseudodesulfovibrio sp. zrk46]|uniref:HD-GYP domain-containing protein n=1 Tax=Pseudodesulfovibrio sp. zrk46 TaxID=2725288 RepID=UPI001449D1ED|nr:HD domain-containing phosphohydrolase [Pseudodesulfovibrio sp. zrk46]QJB56171.1 HD domain-containing protein [Pseudodesulfovibrio sp. zrk46]
MQDVLLLDLVIGVSSALDHISTTVTGHHRRVGIATAIMAGEMGLDKQDATDLIIAGLLHDIGAFSMALRLDGMDFDADLTEHSSLGYRLLRGHHLLERPSHLIRDHHTTWQTLQSRNGDDKPKTDLLANVINLMDRVDILNKVGTSVFAWQHVRSVIGNYSKSLYAPQAVEAFLDASIGSEFREKMEDTETPIRSLLSCNFEDVEIPEEQLLEFSTFFSHIIDFRSRHTATHSIGVAETAVEIARLAGMSAEDQNRMRLAGNLHDIGKLAVPTKLLDKPGALGKDEYSSVQLHATVCEKVLSSIPGLGSVTHWACQHHERLNGKGYPNGLTAEHLSLGSRIMMVADVCTAIAEDRPYRKGMDKEQVFEVLMSMARKGFLDKDLVTLTIDNYEHIDAVRRFAQTKALINFRRFNIA